MTDLRKAAEMALEFCDDIGELGGPYPYVNGTAIVSDSRKVLQVLRQALAQQDKECVAIVNEGMGGIEWLSPCLPDDTPLYAEPPKREWKGLTSDDKHFLLANAWNKEQAFDGFMEAIDRFLERKNT